jgi:site-specific DNA recombinase
MIYICEALKADTQATRLKAEDVLRPRVKEIVLKPGGGELKIDVRGDLAGTVALKRKPQPLGLGFYNLRWLRG